MKTKPASPDPAQAATEPKPSLRVVKTLLAQIHLRGALEQLTDLRKTMRLHALSLDEFLQKASLPPAVVSELLATIQRRDRQCGTRLARLRVSVSKASRLLMPSDATPAKPK